MQWRWLGASLRVRRRRQTVENIHLMRGVERVRTATTSNLAHEKGQITELVVFSKIIIENKNLIIKQLED